MPAIALSICIPTYNRSASVVRSVLEILKCPEPDIEVVVLDNGSSDDTVAQLRRIDDGRFKLYENGVNRGISFNVVNALLSAHGVHCLLLLDKDSCDHRQIAALKDSIRRENPAFGRCAYRSDRNLQAEIFSQGFEALSRVGYSCQHPTGYFFKTDCLRAADVGSRYINAADLGQFGFECMLAEMAFMGPGLIYHAPVFSHETPEAAAKQKSFGTDASREDAFFTPKERLKAALIFVRQINSFQLSGAQKRSLIADRFVHGLANATIGYKTVLARPEICSHYNLVTRSVSTTELLKIGVGFYWQFMEAVYAPRGIAAWLTHCRFVGDLVLGKMRNAASKRLKGQA